MQLSKENSDAGGATGASAGPPAAARPPTSRGQGGPDASSPARPPRKNTAPRRPEPAPRTPEPRSPATSSGTRGDAAPERPLSGPSRRGAKHSTQRGSAAQLSTSSRTAAVPLGEEGVRSYLAEASGCHWERGRRPRPPLGPTRASRRLLNLQVSPRGERACALGLPGGGGARRGGGGGCPEGVRRGGAGPRAKKVRGLQAVFVAATATGSPRVAPRLPCHYPGQRTAPSSLATRTFRYKRPSFAEHLPTPEPVCDHDPHVLFWPSPCPWAEQHLARPGPALERRCHILPK